MAIFDLMFFFVENEQEKIVSWYSGEKRMFSRQEKLSFYKWKKSKFSKGVWSNPFGKSSIFVTFWKLHFLKKFFSIHNVKKKNFLAHIREKRNGKWLFFDKIHGLIPLENFHYLYCFQNFIFFCLENNLFYPKYHLTFFLA